MADKIQVLRVVARTDSFRRAGYQFGADPVDIPMEDFADAQGKKKLAAIMGDRNLVATEVEVEVEVDSDAAQVAQAAPADADTPPAAAARGRGRTTSRG